MAGNKNLRNADKAKKDEFYTQLYDIEMELRHYKAYFKDKRFFATAMTRTNPNFLSILL